MKKFIQEFKEFAMRGNVLDMAIGVVIATAFGQITNTLINNVIMPLIGVLCGGIDLSKWDIVLKEAIVEEGVELVPAVTLGIGTFLTSIINFLLIAFVVFVFVKAMNAAKKPVEEEPEPDPEPTNEEKLLMEIRDLLKEKQ